MELKKILKYASKQEGFTLQEALMGLVLLGIICLNLMSLFKVIYFNQFNFKFDQQVEYLQKNLLKEASVASKIDAANQAVILAHGDQEVRYQCGSSQISRKVDGQGGEVLVSNLSKCEVQSTNNQIWIKLEGKNNEKEIYLGKFT